MERGGGQQETGPPAKVQILEPSGMRPSMEIGRIPGNDTVKATFKLRLVDIGSTKCKVIYSSTRGGQITKDIIIGKK